MKMSYAPTALLVLVLFSSTAINALSTPGFSYVADMVVTRDSFSSESYTAGASGGSFFNNSHRRQVYATYNGYSRVVMEKRVAFTSCSPDTLNLPIKCEDGVTAVPTYSSEPGYEFEFTITRGDRLCANTPNLGCCGTTCNHTDYLPRKIRFTRPDQFTPLNRASQFGSQMVYDFDPVALTCKCHPQSNFPPDPDTGGPKPGPNVVFGPLYREFDEFNASVYSLVDDSGEYHTWKVNEKESEIMNLKTTPAKCHIVGRGQDQRRVCTSRYMGNGTDADCPGCDTGHGSFTSVASVPAWGGDPISFRGSFDGQSNHYIATGQSSPVGTSINLEGTIRKFQHEASVDYRLFNLPFMCYSEENLKKCGYPSKMNEHGPIGPGEQSDVKNIKKIMKATLKEVMGSD
jgi:hypothetical protein